MSLEEIKIEIENKLADVSSALETLKDQQETLSDNAEKLKSAIKDSVNGHARNLRNRQKQIERQIEVITARQRSILEIQIATALHLKGSLNTTKNILDKCEPEDSSTISKIKENHLPSQNPVAPLKLASLQLEGNTLSDAIMNFGKISFPQSITYQDSGIFPARMEEYDDSDHEVLHKSLRGSGPSSSLPESPLRITVNFPKLPATGWLANSNHEKTVVNNVEKPLSSDVSSWLSHLRIAHSPEDDRSNRRLSLETEDEDGFQILPRFPFLRSPEAKLRNSESSSIEVLGSSEDISQMNGTMYGTVNGRIDTTFDSQWTLMSSIDHSGPTDVNSACQANETCSSFRDCVCEGKCEENAVEKALQTPRWLRKHNPDMVSSSTSRKNGILKQMVQILQSDSAKWISTRENDVQESPSKRICYKPTSSSWLRRSEPQTHPCKGLLSEWEKANRDTIWLSHESEGRGEQYNRKQSLNDENSGIKSQSYQAISIDSLKIALAELEEIIPKYGGGQCSVNTSANSSPADDRKMKKWLLKSGHCAADLPKSVIAVANNDFSKWLLNKL